MPAFVDLTGQRFGMLAVIGIHERDSRKRIHWLCRCDCGGESTPVAGNLTSGNSESCGCRKREVLPESTFKDGRCRMPEYWVYNSMKGRCLYPHYNDYEYYGGRGIKVCDRWLNSFENFLADMGPRPSPKHSIERNDGDGDYTPENCYWATWRQQGRNKSNNHWIEWRGKRLIITDWAALAGKSCSWLCRRLAKYPFEEAMSAIPLDSISNQENP